MSNQDDSKFKNSIIEQLVEVTPDENKTLKINPWHKPINYITWGIILTYVTLNFLLLQYILPTIGALLIYIGFSSLRKENNWFNIAWFFAIINMIWQVVYLIYVATPLYYNVQNNLIVGLVSAGVQIVLFLIFRHALKEVFKKANIKSIRDPLLWLVFWIVLVTFFGMSPFANSLLVFIIVFIFYILNIRSLYHVGNDLGDVGCDMVNSYVKMSNKFIGWGYLLTCILILAVCCMCANHTKLDTTKFTEPADSETRAILEEMGFPHDILNDISDENISLLQNAIHVESFTDTLVFDGNNSTEKHEKCDKCNMKATTVYIELPNKLLYVLEYFDWRDGKVFWNDGFTIWGSDRFELLDGYLLYKKAGEDYIASIPRLKCELVTSNNSFFGISQSYKITGGVSYPFGSDSQCGYVFYRFQLSESQCMGCNCLNYSHSTNPIVLPYIDAEQGILLGMRNYEQHYTNFELHQYLDVNN